MAKYKPRQKVQFVWNIGPTEGDSILATGTIRDRPIVVYKGMRYYEVNVDCDILTIAEDRLMEV